MCCCVAWIVNFCSWHTPQLHICAHTWVKPYTRVWVKPRMSGDSVAVNWNLLSFWVSRESHLECALSWIFHTGYSYIVVINILKGTLALETFGENVFRIAREDFLTLHDHRFNIPISGVLSLGHKDTMLVPCIHMQEFLAFILFYQIISYQAFLCEIFTSMHLHSCSKVFIGSFIHFHFHPI